MVPLIRAKTEAIKLAPTDYFMQGNVSFPDVVSWTFAYFRLLSIL